MIKNHQKEIGGKDMRINKQKLLLAMARKCMNAYTLCEKAGIQYATYRRIAAGENCKPATAGLIASVLCVDVAELLED